MAAVQTKLLTTFSSCSAVNLTKTFTERDISCLYNIPSKSFEMICGNGLIETGEDCDCGTNRTCVDPCCEPNTCKFVGDATCSGNVCCENCKLSSTSTVCYTAKGDCEASVKCSGLSATCNFDLKDKAVGSLCSTGNCNGKGVCTSLTSQCTSWGKIFGTNFNECADQGTFNTEYCLQLFCKNPTSSSCTSLTYNDVSVTVENGTSCADGKICLNSVCTSSSAVPTGTSETVQTTILQDTNDGSFLTIVAPILFVSMM